MFFFGIWFVRVQRLGGRRLLAYCCGMVSNTRKGLVLLTRKGLVGFENPKGFGSVNPKGYSYFLNLAVFGGLAALSLCFFQVC
jgi:hypothetical protein